MKQPVLSDYDLKQNDFGIYEKQKKEYEKAYSASSKSCEETNRNIKFGITIMLVVYSFFIILYCSLASDNISAFWVLMLLFGFPLIVILFCSGSIDNNSEMTLGEAIIDTLFIPIVGFGIALYSYFEQHVNLNKYKFIDKNLEDNIIRYNHDIKEFNEYLLRTKEDFWKNLTGYEFEREVAKVFENQGYQALVTRKSGDGGVDIILEKGDKKIAVQCKHHKSKVGPNDVRALQGVVYNGDFTSGIFVSLSGFTPTVKQEVSDSKVQIGLVTLEDLLSMNNDDNNQEIQPKKNTTQVTARVYTTSDSSNRTNSDPFGNHSPSAKSGKPKYRITQSGAVTLDEDE